MRFVFLILFFASPASFAQIAVMHTSMGKIEIQLLPAKAPKTVENFIGLATGTTRHLDVNGKKVNKPFYDGLIIHRASPFLGIFTGCPWGTGRGFPGYTMPEEDPTKSEFDQPGLVAMAKIKDDPRYGSQFFITTRNEPRFNKKYTIFGVVKSGMDVVNKIAAVPTDKTHKPMKRVVVQKVEIITR